MSKIYERYAEDLSDVVFNSVCGELYALAKKEQIGILAEARSRRGRMRLGEAHVKLTEFCTGKLSYGDALAFIIARHPRMPAMTVPAALNTLKGQNGSRPLARKRKRTWQELWPAMMGIYSRINRGG